MASHPRLPGPAQVAPAPNPASERKYRLERVNDAAVVQVYADGFASLPLNEKILIWHLYQGRHRGPRYLLRPAIRP